MVSRWLLPGWGCRQICEAASVHVVQPLYCRWRAPNQPLHTHIHRSPAALEYVVKNALHHLGPGWGLHVYHGRANERFVRESLANVTGAQVCGCASSTPSWLCRGGGGERAVRSGGLTALGTGLHPHSLPHHSPPTSASCSSASCSMVLTSTSLPSTSTHAPPPLPAPCLMQFHQLDAVDVVIPTLNRLLTSPAFWEELQAAGLHSALLLQTDALLVHGRIEPFLQVL